MIDKKLNWVTAGGVIKDNNGSFTLFGHIENNNREKIKSYNRTFLCLNGATIDFQEALKEFKNYLQSQVEFLESADIYNRKTYDECVSKGLNYVNKK